MLIDISLNDRYDLDKQTVLLSGTQALVRAVLMQAARDKKANINSAGYVTGYRGSPLGALDQQFDRAQKETLKWNVVFQPGLNEDSAATALWGSQQAELRGEGKFQGVFGLWYGKGPGVDRSGDVFRHANLAGTSPYGGVLVAMGDDHTGESSTTLHQSEYALVDAMMPILSPSGVQELLDYSAIGWALSRYAGVWVGLKCVKDTVEVTEVVDGSLDRLEIKEIEKSTNFDGAIRLTDLPVDQEKRLHIEKLPAVKRFAKFNNIDREVFKNKRAKIGIVSAGKSWLDTVHALSLLGISAFEAEKLGVTTYKIGMVWPIESDGLIKWARGLEKIIIVEEKRKLIEGQIKDILYNSPSKPVVLGGLDESGKQLFQSHFALDPVVIALRLGEEILKKTKSTSLDRNIQSLSTTRVGETNAPVPPRTPYFCAGCPHNTSTKIPDGSRAYAGIGCHYMAQWMDRNTEGYTHMGGEGANWIGEAPFSKTDHVFQNIGDGTYNHSGLMSIRAAVSSGANITYKILFNDAVAMTGGQSHDGELTATDIIKELQAVGVKKVVGVYDEKEDIVLSDFNNLADIFPRDQLIEVQKMLTAIKGVTALVYIQTCAAEKRRRRKRGVFPNPDKRVFINPEVCEGCGDCGTKSNCVAILPKDTNYGRKRQIDQSSCNKDFSCLDGFCPSFVSIEGAELKKSVPKNFKLPDFKPPSIPKIDQTYNIVVTGVGGTGVVTVGALLAMGAYLDGKGVGVMEMAGLAQKGGAVHIHCRIAERREDISAIRVAYGEAHSLIGGELMVSAGEKTLSLLKRGQTKVVCSSNEANSGEFALDRNFSLPTNGMRLAISSKVGDDNIDFIDAVSLSKNFLGDSIYANILLLGAAWQKGFIPLSMEAIKEAIRLNGAGVEGNLSAFDLGRWAAVDLKTLTDYSSRKETMLIDQDDLDAVIVNRKFQLEAYQNTKLARTFETLVIEAKKKDTEFALAVAKGYHKLLAYKDEYEVARLHVSHLNESLCAEFEKFPKVSFYFAPPFFNKKTKKHQQKKIKFGPWFVIVLKLLSKGKVFRGTALDLFGYSHDRKKERELIREYEEDIQKFILNYTDRNRELIIARALLPMDIKGFGYVKDESIIKASKKRADLLKSLGDNGAFQLQAAE